MSILQTVVKIQYENYELHAVLVKMVFATNNLGPAPKTHWNQRAFYQDHSADVECQLLLLNMQFNVFFHLIFCEKKRQNYLNYSACSDNKSFMEWNFMEFVAYKTA